MIANISGLEQDIVKSENSIANHDHSCTYPPNPVYFGPQMVKNNTRVFTHQGRHFWMVISRTNGHCPL